jgi:hypothetical protein
MQHSSLIRAGITLRWSCTNLRFLVLVGNKIVPAGNMVCSGDLGASFFPFLRIELLLLSQFTVSGELDHVQVELIQVKLFSCRRSQVE